MLIIDIRLTNSGQMTLAVRIMSNIVINNKNKRIMNDNETRINKQAWTIKNTDIA